jgi:hypothetical protein
MIDTEKQINDLKEQLEMEIMVKESEVILNKELNQRITNQELEIEALLDINKKYAKLIVGLRLQLKELQKINGNN